jgi:transcriptional regulator with PAS, ATPase and Fis domain
MTHPCWVHEFPGAVTVCDKDGIILVMNQGAIEAFETMGGESLIGKNLLDCHPEPSRTKLRQMLEAGKANIYTIEKKGKKELIYQSPWYVDGEYAGFVELQLDIPSEMPHFIRG